MTLRQTIRRNAAVGSQYYKYNARARESLIDARLIYARAPLARSQEAYRDDGGEASSGVPTVPEVGAFFSLSNARVRASAATRLARSDSSAPRRASISSVMAVCRAKTRISRSASAFTSV
jgi:hypothetical protein